LSSSKTPSRRPEWTAAIVVLVLGFPLVFAFARALADGTTRLREVPVRAVLGDERFEALMQGEGGAPHYLGGDRRAPDFTLRDRNGRRFRLSDARGKVVVLNFWSITCAPCIEEMPTLETLAEIVADWGNVEVVAVSTDAGWDAVSSILPARPRVRHLFDPDKSVVHGRFGTNLYPETWIIDRDGVIRFRYDGPFDWSSGLALDVVRGFL
jgi:peroxiredoxin